MGNHNMNDEAQIKQIEQLIKDSDAYHHKENVRVYRNVQAATDQLLQKQTQELNERFTGMENQIRTLQEELDKTNTKLDKPNAGKADKMRMLILMIGVLSLILQIVLLIRG